LPHQPDEGFDIPTQLPQRVLLGWVPGLELELVPALGQALELELVPALGQHKQPPS